MSILNQAIAGYSGRFGPLAQVFMQKNMLQQQANLEKFKQMNQLDLLRAKTQSQKDLLKFENELEISNLPIKFQYEAGLRYINEMTKGPTISQINSVVGDTVRDIMSNLKSAVSDNDKRVILSKLGITEGIGIDPASIQFQIGSIFGASPQYTATTDATSRYLWLGDIAKEFINQYSKTNDFNLATDMAKEKLKTSYGLDDNEVNKINDTLSSIFRTIVNNMTKVSPMSAVSHQQFIPAQAQQPQIQQPATQQQVTPQVNQTTGEVENEEEIRDYFYNKFKSML